MVLCQSRLNLRPDAQNIPVEAVACILALLSATSDNPRGSGRCRRNRSGQSTLKHHRTTAFNDIAATCSVENSYFHANSTGFYTWPKLVGDQGVGDSNPLSPTRGRI